MYKSITCIQYYEIGLLLDSQRFSLTESSRCSFPYLNGMISILKLHLTFSLPFTVGPPLPLVLLILLHFVLQHGHHVLMSNTKIHILVKCHEAHNDFPHQTHIQDSAAVEQGPPFSSSLILRDTPLIPVQQSQNETTHYQ